MQVVSSSLVPLAHIGHHSMDAPEGILHFFSHSNHWGPLVFVIILAAIAAWKIKAHQRK